MTGGERDALDAKREQTGQSEKTGEDAAISEAEDGAALVGGEPPELGRDSGEGQEQTIDAEELVEQLEAATRKAEENWEKLLRVQADMDNLRRRTAKDVENAHKFGLEKFLRELLPVVDSLEFGIQAAAGEGDDVVKFREGMDLTLKQFLTVFEKFNVLAVDPLGQMFDPEKHQAMTMQPTADAEPNTVVSVFQKGYLLNDRLLRPAMVVVAQAVDEGARKKIDEQA